MKKLFTVLALIVGLASAAGAALAETRVALVIGNNEYVTLLISITPSEPRTWGALDITAKVVHVDPWNVRQSLADPNE
jgi:hypothetical protein